jgi:hypothetical protein
MPSRSIVLALSTASMLTLAAVPPATAAPVAGQVDTFEDGTIQGWLVGVGPLAGNHPAPPANIGSGGPGGVDDNFLQLRSVSGSSSPGGRLSVLNLTQWAGNYTAAGITALQMDLKNFGPSDLSLRLLFEGGGPSQTDRAWSTVPVTLPAVGEWQRLTFPIALSDLTLGINNSIADALATVTAVRLFHGSASAFPGEGVVATLGVDNITAIGGGTTGPGTGGGTAPEPTSMLLVATGLGLMLWHRQRKTGALRSADAPQVVQPLDSALMCNRYAPPRPDDVGQRWHARTRS